MHNLIFRSRGRSYRELPLRLFEFGSVYRYEKSGVVHGLTRARGFTQDDAHIYCTRSRCRARSGPCSSSCSTCCGTTASTSSTWSCPPATRRSRSARDEDWEKATEALREAAEASGLELVLDPGGAAFYGPRSASRPRTPSGAPGSSRPSRSTSWSRSGSVSSTPRPTARGSEPIMIHRALFGSIERFFGVLIEHYAGAFPAWLAPVQVVAIPVTGEQVPFVEGIAAALRAHGVRVEVDAGDDRMQKKIRTHTLQKVPFLLLAGARDAEAGAVASGSVTARSSTGCRSSRRSRPWSTGCAGGRTPHRAWSCSGHRVACPPWPTECLRLTVDRRRSGARRGSTGG